MSNKDYTKYAKSNAEMAEKVNDTVEPEKVFVTGTVIDPIVDPTAIAEPELIVEPVAIVEEEPVIEHEPESEIVPDPKFGRVYNCAKLNVRKEPKATAPVICELFCNAEVEIHEHGSTDDFYMVYTASGLTGFCMKSYILVK